MKTKVMGTFALLIVALSVVGFAYAHWSETIKINGVVEMGSLTVGFTTIVREWDKEDWLTYYGQNPEGKDYGDVNCWLDEPYQDPHVDPPKTVYRKLWCEVTNAYGEYWGINKFTIDNGGTVPAVANAITITFDPAVLAVREVIPDIMWEFTDILEGVVVFNVWLYNEPPDYGPGWEIDPPWMFPAPYPTPLTEDPCKQIDPCDSILVELCVHVKQSAPECHTYYFDIEIEYLNWDP